MICRSSFVGENLDFEGKLEEDGGVGERERRVEGRGRKAKEHVSDG